MTNIQKLRYRAEVLEMLETTLKYEAENLTRRYEPTGEKYQAKDPKTGELLWEDEEHTIPVMHDKYEYVDIPLDELELDASIKLQILEDLHKNLERLIAE